MKLANTGAIGPLKFQAIKANDTLLKVNLNIPAKIGEDKLSENKPLLLLSIKP